MQVGKFLCIFEFGRTTGGLTENCDLVESPVVLEIIITSVTIIGILL